MDQRYVIVRYNVFFNGCLGCVQGVVYVVFFFFYFYFCGSVYVQDSYFVGQFCQVFLQFFVVVVGCGLFNLLLDLIDVGLNQIFGIVVVYNCGVVFVYFDFFVLFEEIQGGIFQFVVVFFIDDSIIGQYGNVFQYSFVVVIKVWCFYCYYLKGVVQVVDYKGVQCCVFDVFCNDQQWFVFF